MRKLINTIRLTFAALVSTFASSTGATKDFKSLYRELMIKEKYKWLGLIFDPEEQDIMITGAELGYYSYESLVEKVEEQVKRLKACDIYEEDVKYPEFVNYMVRDYWRVRLLQKEGLFYNVQGHLWLHNISKNSKNKRKGESLYMKYAREIMLTEIESLRAQVNELRQTEL